MRKPTAALHVVAASLALGSLACGPAFGAPRAGMPANAIRVVPAGDVKGTCTCDDDGDEDDAPLRNEGIEYVKLDEWPAPHAVRAFEASHPSRGLAEPSMTSFPTLTLHEPIGETTIARRYRVR